MKASNLWGDQERARSRKAKVAKANRKVDKARRVADNVRHPAKAAGRAAKNRLFG